MLPARLAQRNTEKEPRRGSFGVLLPAIKADAPDDARGATAVLGPDARMVSPRKLLDLALLDHDAPADPPDANHSSVDDDTQRRERKREHLGRLGPSEQQFLRWQHGGLLCSSRRHP